MEKKKAKDEEMKEEVVSPGKEESSSGDEIDEFDESAAAKRSKDSKENYVKMNQKDMPIKINSPILNELMKASASAAGTSSLLPSSPRKGQRKVKAKIEDISKHFEKFEGFNKSSSPAKGDSSPGKKSPKKQTPKK